MATDVSLSYTIDDDITFERMRHMPRRTQFVSTYRKLSWQYDKEVKQHELVQKIIHLELSRAKIAMAEKLNRLQDAKQQVERKKGDYGAIPDRHFSVPSYLLDASRTDPKETIGTKGVVTPVKHSHSASSFPVAAMIPEVTEHSSHPQKKVSFSGTPEAQYGRTERRGTIAVGVMETSSLPPHLVRRVSQFMDSTSALLQSSGDSRRGKDSLSTNSEQQ